jgi:predicted transcriptional regulator
MLFDKMRKRGYEDIVATMLTTAATKEGTKKTYMLFAASILNKYGYEIVSDLHDYGLLRYEDSKGRYFITEKGKRFLTTYKRMVDLLFSTKGRPRSDT